ncbi:hypothetical protein ABZ442_04795 [Streptomyces triculaminicus]|uniref:hypothetical protein n=1 Tax=Streptomyces triculaminicus TaxID=2816232 RepID=UPI0033F2E77C
MLTPTDLRPLLTQHRAKQWLARLSRCHKAAAWLVSRDDNPGPAWAEWKAGRPALLQLGRQFDAIRLPATATQEATDTAGRESLEWALRDHGINSAVIVDSTRRWLYALVPPGTATHSTDGLEVLSRDTCLGVPPPHYSDGPGTYWLMAPPDSDDMLCDPAAIRALLKALEMAVPQGSISGREP